MSRGKECKENTPQNDHKPLLSHFFLSVGEAPLSGNRMSVTARNLCFRTLTPRSHRERSATKPSWPMGCHLLRTATIITPPPPPTAGTVFAPAVNDEPEQRRRRSSHQFSRWRFPLRVCARAHILSLAVPVFYVFKGSRILPYILSPITLHANVRSIVPIVGVG